MSNKEKVRTAAFGAAIWKVMERFGSAFFSLLVQLVLARLLTPADFGAVAIVVVFTNLATVFVQSGMNTALVQDETADEVDSSTVFWFSFAMATVLYGALFVAAPLIEAYYDISGLGAVLRVLGILLFVNAYNCVQVALLQRALKMKEQFKATLIASFLSGAIGILMAFLGCGIWALVSQMLLQQLVSCIAMAFQIRWRPRRLFSFSSLSRMFKFGWKLLASSLLHTIYLSLYDLIVGKVFSAAALGNFSQGRKIPAQVESVLDNAVVSVTLPAAVMLRESLDDLRALMRRALQVATTVVTPIMLALCVTGDSLVTILLGSQWAAAVPFFMIFCFEAILSPITRINLQCFNAVGRSDLYLKLEVIKKFIAIAMILAASLTRNLMLIAWTSVAYSVVAVILNAHPSKRLFRYGLKQQICDFVPSLLISALSAGAAVLPALVVDDSLVLLFLQPATLIFMYIAINEIVKTDSYAYTKAMVIDAFKVVLSKWSKGR